MKNNEGWCSSLKKRKKRKKKESGSSGDMGREIKRWVDRGSERDRGTIGSEGWELIPF